jgi:hypothetical protein
MPTWISLELDILYPAMWYALRTIFKASHVNKISKWYVMRTLLRFLVNQKVNHRNHQQ